MTTPAVRQLRRTRRSLYRWARILGDVNAVVSGTVPQRVARKVVYRSTNRQVGRILRGLGL